jgi:aspartate/methionine/tyrosine aminotransferase
LIFSELPVSGLSLDRNSTLQPTAVRSILAEARGENVVSLLRGEPDLPTPAHIVEACARALRNGRTGYPDNRGEKSFREAVAQKLERDNQLCFDPSTEILATCGATFGIYAALAALLDEGSDVLLPDPIYDAYQSPIRLAGGSIRPVAASIKQGRFSLSVEALERAWSPSVKALILNTPWNPVGTVLTREELEHIGHFCKRRNVILISDEVYEAITYARDHVSPLAALPGLRSRYLHINSLSATYAMTGWRVGYCAGPAELIQRMFLVTAQSSRGPATFVQDAAAEALTGPQDCVAEMREEYTRRRGDVLSALTGIPRVRVLAPEGGFFAMVDVSGVPGTSNEIRQRLLCQHGVAVMHGAAYGPAGEGMLRVSFAGSGDTLRKDMLRLREGLSCL